MTEDMTAIFREELRDLLESLERGLLDLTATPDDLALVNQVFRDLHTIKGSGAMFGFADLAAFIHDFETLFERVRSGQLTLTGDLIRLALSARDEIPRLVAGEADPEGRRTAILAAVASYLPDRAAHAPAGDGGPTEADTTASARLLRFRLTGPTLGLGTRPEAILSELRALGAEAILADSSAIPSLDQLDTDICHVTWSMRLPGTVTQAQIEDVFLFSEADWSLDGDGSAETPDPATTAPPALPPQPFPQALHDAPRPVPALPETQAQDDTKPTASPRTQAGATVRVPADRLDAMMDAVGELVIVEARLTELARQSRDAALLSTAEQITRLAAGLRDATMTMRMVPMRSLVARFRRLVVDLSQQLGKPVSFTVHGEDTELDKTVIDKLADPLVHILRNALDHGMETTAERLAEGKPESGTIELTAEHSGAEVLVRVRDDGRGMRADTIRAKAVSRGMIAPDAILTEAQIFALIFEPGFSTAAEITELSGRGVGMDVVRRTIESLRGGIDIASSPGRGTTVTLRLPLTLAIVEGLLVEVAGEKYTLPMAAVHEIVAVPPDKAEPRRGEDFLDIRGRFVPFLRLRSVFDCDGTPPADQNVVIVSAGDERVGIVVDRIVATNQTVIKQMSKLHASVRAVSGATILGDGSVALILDVAHLVGLGRSPVPEPTLPREVAA